MVGAGGTGSIFLTHLCRIHSAWTALGGEPFTITVFDDDLVTEANLARQVFCEPDIGMPKAAVLAQRAMAFFGIEITAAVAKFSDLHTGGYRDKEDGAIVVVGCVDNLAARRKIRTAIKRPRAYWLDIGNTADSGQVVLGGRKLPDFFDLHPAMLKAKDPKNLPSCSMAEALARQDLFVNSTLANLGGQLLWHLMRKGGLNHHGYYANLATGRTVPIPIKG